MTINGFLVPTETMKRLTQRELCDNFDVILEEVDQENIGYVTKKYLQKEKMLQP